MLLICVPLYLLFYEALYSLISFSLLIIKHSTFEFRTQEGGWWASCGAKRQKKPPLPPKRSCRQKVGYTTLTLIVFIRSCHPLCRATKSPSSAAYRMTETIWFNFTLFCSLSWCTICIQLCLSCLPSQHSEGRQGVSYDIDSERDEGGDGSYDEEERRASESASTLPTAERDIYGNMVSWVQYSVAIHNIAWHFTPGRTWHSSLCCCIPLEC